MDGVKTMDKREAMARAACMVGGLDPDEEVPGARARWYFYLPLVDAIIEVYEAKDDG